MPLKALMTFVFVPAGTTNNSPEGANKERSHIATNAREVTLRMLQNGLYLPVSVKAGLGYMSAL